MKLSVEIINQLSDNYSYVIYKNDSNSSIVIDPAEAEKIINILRRKKLNLDYIFITHHHNDHTSGVIDLVKAYPKVKIFSPSKLDSVKTNAISESDKIITNLNVFKIIAAPGHTLDHIVLSDEENNLLFVGDVLFRLGCGRIFEGTFEQMQKSLEKLSNMPDKMLVYSGHEYTLNNLKFLEHIFSNNKILEHAKKEITSDLNLTGRSIPFVLGKEKKCNPFLNQKCEMAAEFRNTNKYTDHEFFSYLRVEKDSF
ncbi:hydroxyacylglutathione hydrolase [Pelagibacterales bacterium SAG-MED31]|nr:hydroxyacylglutathione hydrolase [Pelagibacterales bacterium SAG-MED31]